MMEPFAIALVIGTVCGILANVVYHWLDGNRCLYTVSAIIFAGWMPTFYFAHIAGNMGGQLYTCGLIVSMMIGVMFAGLVRSLINR